MSARCRFCENDRPLTGIGLCYTCMHLQIGASGNEIEDQGPAYYRRKPTKFDQCMNVVIIAALVGFTLLLVFLDSQ